MGAVERSGSVEGSGAGEVVARRVANLETLSEIQAATVVMARIAESLPAEWRADATVLILGSMPGTRSLQLGEYYGHTRNRFWRIMEGLVGLDPDAPYAVRRDQLTRAGIALWDVLKYCSREGSLDRSIIEDSEVPNEIAAELESHAAIQAVALNGKKAARAFAKRIMPDLGAEARRRVHILELPSTSPANAARSLASLVDEWRVLAPYLAHGA